MEQGGTGSVRPPAVGDAVKPNEMTAKNHGPPSRELAPNGEQADITPETQTISDAQRPKRKKAAARLRLSLVPPKWLWSMEAGSLARRLITQHIAITTPRSNCGTARQQDSFDHRLLKRFPRQVLLLPADALLGEMALASHALMNELRAGAVTHRRSGIAWSRCK